jgi:chromosome segregation ATPase
MSSISDNYDPSAEDLEDTAELPILPEEPALAGAPAAAPLHGQLEENLRAFTENLRALEENLRVKSHELTVFEREVGARDRQIAELQSQLQETRTRQAEVEGSSSKLQVELEQLRGQFGAAVVERDRHMAALAKTEFARDEQELALARSSAHASDLQARADHYFEALQTVEVQRQVFEGMVAERELRLDATEEGASTRVAELETRLAAVHQREQALQYELQFSRGQSTELERQLAEAAARHSALVQDMDKLRAAVQQNEQQLLTQKQEAGGNTTRLERDLRDRANTIGTLQQQIAAAQVRAEKGVVDLAAAEERNSGMQLQLQQRQARIESLNEIEAGLRTQLREAGETLANRNSLIEGQLHEAGARHAAQGQELEHLRAALRQQEQRAATQLQESVSGAGKLERELRDHMDMIQALQQQASAATIKIETGAADLGAAEERIRSLQIELQQRDVRIERLNEVEAGLNNLLREAAETLANRDALIARLENQAASSAAVLGNIQHNLERLGSEAALPQSGQAAAGNGAAAVSGSVTAENLVRLLVPATGDARVVHLLGRKTSIGRTPDNDICINAEFISRHHAVILTSSTSAIIEDLNSTNGVAVNGRRVTRQVLNEGDLVAIGKSEFHFVLKPVAERPG